jgi:outer membrane lipoprotein carrier protein
MKLLYIALLVLSSPVFAGSNALDLFFSNTHSLTANFKQTIADKYGKPIEQSQGLLSIKRPNKFYLEYTKPDEQRYISDGKTLWVYDEGLEQVTISAVDEKLLNSPVLLITSDQNIRELYDVKETIDYNNPDHDIFILTSKEVKDEADKIFSNIQLIFNKSQLIEIKMADNFDQVTRLNLYNQINNARINDEVFSFTIPEGIDVIGTQPN